MNRQVGLESRLAEFSGHEWDLLIIGGGITGAGIFRLASHLGLRTLLLEQRDFAWGTSSRSGKLVHGGLRYLKQGAFNLTRESVKERERLLAEASGLVEPLGFLFPFPPGQGVKKGQYALGMAIYDLLAGRRSRSCHDRQDFLMLSPFTTPDLVAGGLRTLDAGADDARLVLRLIMESVADGGTALNYLAVTELLTGANGRVNGVLAIDNGSGEEISIAAKAVINATGAWVDTLRAKVGGKPCIRPLRGSHLVFSSRRFPIHQALSFQHPADNRPVYVLPWEGGTLVGTTDVDHGASLNGEPVISSEERQYLLDGVQQQFEPLALRESDIIATFAGVRPVVGSGKADPSKESREMLLLNEAGLLTITGGKLTTFRVMALKALTALKEVLQIDTAKLEGKPMFRPPPQFPAAVPHSLATRLAGRYGSHWAAIVESAAQSDLAKIPGTPYIWGELRHTARHEAVHHLDDLLLRRLRLGLLLPDGGRSLLPLIRKVVQPELKWDDEKWETEVIRYLEIRGSAYA